MFGISLAGLRRDNVLFLQASDIQENIPAGTRSLKDPGSVEIRVDALLRLKASAFDLNQFLLLEKESSWLINIR